MELYNPDNVNDLISFENGEFVATLGDFKIKSVYQPIFKRDLSDTFGFEALIRISKGGNDISPLVFLSSFTSETEITNINILCYSLHMRNVKGLNLLGRKIFMNAHPKAFCRISMDEYSVRKTLERVSESNLEISQVIFEITEFEESDNVKFINGIQRFRDAGITIAIDDYGVLESNDKRVKLLNPNIIKIDRSLITYFCKNPKKSKLPNLLTRLKKQGVDIVIEGIENINEFESLTNLPFDYVQGYYFGKPGNYHNRNNLT